MLIKMTNYIIPTMHATHDETLIIVFVVIMIMNLGIGRCIEAMTSRQIDKIVEKIRDIDAKLDAKDSDDESSEYEVEEFEPATFEFTNGLYAHYFEDPDSQFVVVLPDYTLRGESIIEASIGHVTRSNPNGNPIITYIDSYGERETYVLPDYAGRGFCEFINRKI